MAKKKAGAIPGLIRRNWAERNTQYSIRRQCDLAGISRSTFYHTPAVESEKNLRIMRLIDEQYLQHPEYGSPRMTDWLRDNGWSVNHKRVERLWWSVKYENVYPRCYSTGTELARGLKEYFDYYNHERKHSSLEKKTPAEIYHANT